MDEPLHANDAIRRTNGQSTAPPRVVMLLANDFTHDTRVYKEARSLMTWGCEVHVVAMCGPDLPASELRDGIYIHRAGWRSWMLVRLGLAVLFWPARPLVGRLLPPMTPARAARAGARPATTAERNGRAPGHRRTAIRRLARRYLGWLLGDPGTRRIRTTVDRFEPITHPVAAMLALSFRSVRRIGCTVRQLLGSVHRRPGRVLRRILPSSLRLLAFNVPCARVARYLRPDVIQAHDLNTLMGATLVKRIHGVPLVYDSHELFLERNLGNRSRAYDKLVWAPVERFCIRQCDAVISVADGICRHLARQYGIPTPHLVRNVQPYVPPAPHSRILSEELGIDPRRPIVIYAGAVTVHRGLEVMIDSAEHLEDAVYVIMGYARNAKYAAALQERAEARGVLNRRLWFREAVPMDQVVRYVASADLGIVPTVNVCLSYYYESSNKIFHCLMAGVPLVMSDHAEKRLLVEQWGIGALMDETDPREVARVVNGTLADRVAYDRMRLRCLAAARVLNWEHEEQKLRQLFAACLGDRVPPVPAVDLPFATDSRERPVQCIS